MRRRNVSHTILDWLSDSRVAKSKIIFFVLVTILFLFGISCNNSSKHELNSSSKKINFDSFITFTLTKSEQGNFVKPKFTKDDNGIVFLSADFSSLWIQKFKSEKLEQIFTDKNKIVDFIPIGKYDSVFVALRDYSPNAKVKSYLNFTAKGIVQRIYESKNSISSLALSENNNLIFFEGNQIKFFDVKNFRPTEKLNEQYSSVFIDTTSILIYENGKTDKINLTNHQNVVWVNKLSKDSLLIYSNQDKLILLAFSLKDIKKIGDYTSPVYNKVYKKLVVSKLTDDGLKEITGDLFLMNLRNMNLKNLTNTPNEIEANSIWSHDGKKLVYDVSGQIKLIEFGQSNPITK